MATSKVVMSEKDILLLLREFLEENGHYKCLVAFERSTGLCPPSLSAELVSLREVILWGNLEELQKRIFEPLRNMGEESELRKCKYAIAKQRYLETLVEVSSDKADLLKQQLEEVEELCPSSEEFKALFSLLTLPSLSASPEYRDWSVQKGRLQCFYQLASWISKVLGMNARLISPLNSSHPPEQKPAKTRLTQLLAKGLLYERCEGICAHPATTEQDSNDGGDKLLDLYNWIKHQPDSAFQLSPSTLQLQVRGKSGAVSEDSNEDSVRDNREGERVMGESSRPLLMEESPHTQSSSDSQQQNSTTNGDEQQARTEATREKATDKDMVHQNNIGEVERNVAESKSAENVAQDGSENQLGKEAANLHPESNTSANSDSKEAAGAIATVQLAKLTPNMMKFDDNFVDKNPSSVRFGGNFPDGSEAIEQTPPHQATKKGRKSSTPKPSSSNEPTQQPPSPSTSPVPRVPSAQAAGGVRPIASVAEEPSTMSNSKAKKHIDFSENLEESIVFPTAKLLGHVKDKQVVRSVAFSKSGSIVAIGANSRTLRLCYTEPLLQENNASDGAVDQELPVFYSQHHYHKGSIYCMSWWGDTLLASGSNDQTIRLLSYDPTSQIAACTPLGQMKIHKGTIRDVVFMPNGLLVSGGVGDNIIKVSNPSTGQIVNTLFGHYSQIHGLYTVKENIIASASQDKTVKLWDLRMGQSYATIKLPHSVASVAANTYTNQIASALLDGACAVHDLNTLKQISTYNAHSDECRTVRYSSSAGPSPWLLTGSYDGTICVADTKTFEWQQVAQHTDKVVQCRWHTQSMFASTGADNRACFWRLDI